MFEVIFYKDKAGREPIKELIYELKKKSESSKHERIQFEKIMTYIGALQEYGTRIGNPILKHIVDDLWELRPLENRIIFFYWQDNKFVLLHHFIKKTNKTPIREIEQAETNRRQFLERIK